ncbi:MAG: asparagine synthase (glutamine-hydrolyzing), partial [Bacteroidota bacterium]
MCGIHVYLADSPQDEPLAQMVASATHRGPDHSAQQSLTVPSGWLGMGANRLMISDRSPASHQPMAGPDGSWLVYNGELYNAFELRNELLQLGNITFTTASDTEVLLHALKQWGPAVIPRLNGMFAFAFWHGEKQELWLARDPVGIKPLYWTDTKTGRMYSSEVRALSAGLGQPLLPDTQELTPLLAQRYPKVTGYPEVHALPPGTYHRWSAQHGEFESVRYSPPRDKSPSEDPKNPPPQLKELLTDALLRQSEAQVPMGMFLSGGVDSTLLLALQQEEGIPRLPAFTVAHRKEDQRFGTRDGEYAEQAAKQYRTTVDALEVTPKVLDRFPEYIQAMDVPLGDSGGLLTWLLAERAKAQGFGVVLSGAGADELFAGYHRLAAYQRYLRRPEFWHRTGPLLRRLSPLLPTAKGIPGRAYFQLLRKFAQRIGAHPAETWRRFQGLTLPPEAEGYYQEQAEATNWLAWAYCQDQEGYLPKQVLALSDTFTMAHGLELRVPYLDADLVAWAQQLPAEFPQGGPQYAEQTCTAAGSKHD